MPRISFNLTWSLTLEIVSVDTVGGVQVQIKDYDPSNPSKPYYSLTYNNDTSTLKGTLIKSLTPHYADDVNNMIQQRFTVLFATLQTTLQTKLQNQHKLFLAGQGAFFFKNATFNQEGDFLTQVLYNGTDAPDVSLSHKLVTTPGKDLAAEQAAKAVEEAHALAKSASETASQKIKLATQPKASQAAKVAADFAKAHAKHLAGHAESLAQIHAKGLGQTAGTMVPVNGAN